MADKIAAKYEQLDSGEFRAVGTPGFNAKSAQLVCFFGHMSQLYQRLNLPMPHTTSQAAVLLALKNIFLDLNLYSRQAVLVRVWRV